MDLDAKAKAMFKPAESRLNPEALSAYKDLSLKKTAEFDGLVLKSDGKVVTIENKSTPDTPITTLVPDAQPRFLIATSKDKLVLIFWKPPTAKAMDCMKYSSVMGGVEKDVGNLKTVTIGELEELKGFFI